MNGNRNAEGEEERKEGWGRSRGLWCVCGGRGESFLCVWWGGEEGESEEEGGVFSENVLSSYELKKWEGPIVLHWERGCFFNFPFFSFFLLFP